MFELKISTLIGCGISYGIVINVTAKATSDIPDGTQALVFNPASAPNCLVTVFLGVYIMRTTSRHCMMNEALNQKQAIE